MNVVTQFPLTPEPGHDPRLQSMFEAAVIGIAICQLDGRILEANPALSRLLGGSPQELTGTPPGDLYLETARESGRTIYPENFRPDQRLLDELLRGERPSFDIERLYRRQDGSEFWGHLTVSLGRDVLRQPTFLIAMLADATERHRVEERLIETEKMAVIGRLAGGIAHDFNNLLTGILLYCDLLSAGLENAEVENAGLKNGGFENRWANTAAERTGLAQHVDEVRMAGEQGAALTRQLLALARKPAAEPRPMPVNAMVTSSKNLLRRLLGEQIELVLSLDPVLDPPPSPGAELALADPASFRQILLNLVLNARDAMPQGGKITVSTRLAEFPSRSPAATPQLALSIVVQDNGCGMDKETRSRLFEPLFTTKLPEKGTGLGLATVQRIVSDAGGTIEVKSAPGSGTAIEVLLPAIQASREELQRPKADSS